MGTLRDRPTRLRLVLVALAVVTLGLLAAPPFGSHATAARTVPAVLTTAATDPSWHHLYPSTVPYGMPVAPVVYDPTDHELVLLTAALSSAGTWYFHTWAYYLGAWHKLAIASPNLFNSEDTWDGADGYLLLFGGACLSDCAPQGLGHQTWTFLHNKWTERFPSTYPPARASAVMAYDPAAGETVLFGGESGSVCGGLCPERPVLLNDTWTWSRGVWTHRSPATHPSARLDSSLGYDARDRVLVLFGGFSPTDLADTWTFAANSWTHRYPSTHPSARDGSAVTFDPNTDTYLLEGGLAINTGTSYYDTWAWATGHWTRVATAGPTPDNRGSMAYDAAAGYPVLMGRPSTGTSVGTWGYF